MSSSPRRGALLRPLGAGLAASRGVVEVPGSGVTRIGRGPLLGVTDKRVSREHGLLELVEGKLRLKPLHVNPCYHGAQGSTALRPLPRGEWTWLQPGDRLALLADAFVYEVIYVPEDGGPHAEESAQADDERQHAEEQLVGKEVFPKETKGERVINSPKSEPRTSQGEQQSTSSALAVSDCTGPKKENGTSCAPDTSQNLPHPSQVDAAIGEQPNIQRERKLPAWMLTDDDDVQEKTPTKSKGGKGKGSAKPQAAAHGQGAGKRRGPGSDDEDEVEIGTQKKRKITSTKVKEQEEDRKSSFGNEEPGSCDDLNELPAESDLASVNSAGDPRQKEEAVPLAREDQRDVPQTSSGQSVSSQHSLQQQQPVQPGGSQRRSPSPGDSGRGEGTPPQKMQRTPCLYAERCYRKNPLHFQECSHPGDLDYVVDEVADTDKPDCPYGTSCYRQNPQHRMAFNHTNPPVAGTRRSQRRTTKRANDEDSGDDGEDSDLEDSFIDDDDYSEGEEGSEWDPELSDGEEDLKTLNKEAKQFIRKKKV
ncbi:aprataxin and PNK-like factor [Petromyzon marinus]|uniref:aprataxin and PNK-like factor n=1 Tax=Petromyzon marinus TaxID=7757 RepID=UPI003F6FB06A